MKHYKHPETGEVFAYESEQERKEWGAPELVAMTTGEVDAHLNPVPTIDSLAARKRSEIDTTRDTTLQAGLPYTMPDGTQETVQTRAQDEPNLLGLAIEARDLKAEGVTDPVLTLRVESNRNYQLTPQQMIELTDAAKNYKKLILGKSWHLKDSVDAALADEDREAIEAIKWE